VKGQGWRELAAVAIGSALLTAALTYPVAFKLGSVGRIDNADGRFAIWNVAWVARALVRDPRHVFDANIFYPHRSTLAYSENNLGAGALAAPVYWLSGGNPYAAHNFAMLVGFILTATGTYYLVRHLTGDRRAAVVSAIGFAFCPYVFGHTSHIQLLMTSGLPFSMLAFHRLVDGPTLGRGAALGIAMAGQAIFCGYYGVFLILMVGWSIVVVAMRRGLWTDRRFWTAIAMAALVAIVLVLPAFAPYVSLQRRQGFSRSLDDARRFPARWSGYLASSSYAHAWMLRFLPPWGSEVLFPGFVVTTLGLAGAWVSRRTRRNEVTLIYGSFVVLAFWSSFGPAAGMYTVLYKAVPVFDLLRVPGRFGLIVVFGLAILAGLAVSALLSRSRQPNRLAAVLCLATAGELFVGLEMAEVPPVAPVYRMLATLPARPVIEMPFYYPQVGLYQHTKYMLASTSHWMPLVNGYSDYTPPDFFEHVMVLATFPSHDALKILEPGGVRYALFHMYGYNTENRNDVMKRLAEFEAYLRPLYIDDTTRLYELVGYPP
jgi:hypothetical protein